MTKKITKKMAQDLIKNNFGLSTKNLTYVDCPRSFRVDYGKDFWISISQDMRKASRSTYEFFKTYDMYDKAFYNDYYISLDIYIGGERHYAKYTHDLKLIYFKYRDDED